MAGKVVVFVRASGRVLLATKNIPTEISLRADVQGKGCSSYRVNEKPLDEALNRATAAACRRAIGHLHENSFQASAVRQITSVYLFPCIT